MKVVKIRDKVSSPGRVTGPGFRSRGGFTLVEIIIVLAIIGIVIAIAAPTWFRQREISRGNACQENLHKINGAIEQYAMDFRAGQGDPVTMDDLLEPNGVAIPLGYLKKEPVCPAGGDYTLPGIGIPPECSYSAPSWAPQHEL